VLLFLALFVGILIFDISIVMFVLVAIKEFFALVWYAITCVGYYLLTLYSELVVPAK
tara:strand:+ start:148 stop:318 length:171 start_codon:yes stop_codon:yes gene_type:complete